MDKPGKCDDASNENNRKIAKGRVKHLYACIDIEVTDRTATTITFSASNTDGTKGTYTANWGDEEHMWASCPSSLPSQAKANDAGPPPELGSTGKLLLSDQYLSSTSISYLMPKWPRSAAAEPDYLPLKIWPVSIKLYGVEMQNNDGFDGTIDLLDANLCERGQSITLDHETVTLQLSKEAFSRFHTQFDAYRKLGHAVEVIQSKHLDPDALARAWQIVAMCIDQMPGRIAADTFTARDKELLHSVLPDLK